MAFILGLMHSCTFTQKIKNGEMAYERKQYALASELLEEQFQRSQNKSYKARTAFLLGKSNMKMLDYEEALRWFLVAKNENYGDEVTKELGFLYKILERYDDAIATFEDLKKSIERQAEAEREILICKEAIRWKSETSPYTVERIFENSSGSDYSPVIYDGNFIVFSSDRDEATGSTWYNWTGNRFSDLFIMNRNGSEVRKFDSAINSKHNEGTVCFNSDYTTMYFTRCQRDDQGDDFCKIMYSSRLGGLWEEPEDMPFTIGKVQFGHPTLIERDSVLVFTSDMAAPGGNFDLYYAELFEDGTWSKPEPMPRTINTDGNEKFPTADGDTLYFSSDYLPGMGGYDIFKTYLRPDGKWASPINMKYPINSGADDFGFIIDRNAKLTGDIIEKGFFSSSRKGQGMDDIYRYSKRKIIEEKKDEPIIADDKKKIIQVFLAGRTFENVFEDDDPNKKWVDKTPLGSTFIQLIDDQNVRIAESSSDSKGIFIFELAEDRKYKIVASKKDYLNKSIEVNTYDLPIGADEKTYTINLEIILDKIYYDKEINISDIFYEYDRWELTPQAIPNLQKLADLMIQNPQINIQLSSHTDCRGDAEYNQILSQRRAQSVVDFLIAKGISETKLYAQGYGKERLIVLCDCLKCTEEEHQANRRTSFTILSK